MGDCASVPRNCSPTFPRAGLAAEFAAAYPEVRLEINAEDRLVDLVEEGYDVVIRTNPSPDDNLVGRCFLRDQILIVARTSMTRPVHGSDPDANIHVPAVVRTTAAEDTLWRASDDSGSYNLVPDPVLRLSSLIMVRDAVRAGAGAAMLPRSLVAEDLATGRLASWGTAAGRNVEVWVLHASRRLASRKVTAFVQFLCNAHAGNSTR